MNLKGMIAIGLVSVSGCVWAAEGCDVAQLRVLNQLADENHGGGATNGTFNYAMRELLKQNRRGCALPSGDPGSVLFRGRAARLL